MGEYVTVTVYKPMEQEGFLPNKFNQLCWDLYHAKNDRKKIEQIYRGINFVMQDGRIFDLNIRFLEKDGVVYQTNTGVYGSKDLPNLSLFYKYHFHDFWLAILKPDELIMNEHDMIECVLEGRTIHNRFFDLVRANDEAFQKTTVWDHWKKGNNEYPILQQVIKENDIVEIDIGHIYDTGDGNYRDEARKNITAQRKDIASKINIPYWSKKTPQ